MMPNIISYVSSFYLLCFCFEFFFYTFTFDLSFFLASLTFAYYFDLKIGHLVNRRFLVLQFLCWHVPSDGTSKIRLEN